MYSQEIDVSYFAAGIAAHLASDDQLDWSKIIISKSKIVEELGNVVLNWKTHVQDLVAYRSFKPFYPLMKESQPIPVQMWAVWAVHHVCCNKGERYGPMLGMFSHNMSTTTIFGHYLVFLSKNLSQIFDFFFTIFTKKFQLHLTLVTEV